jgi:hypothetical protein
LNQIATVGYALPAVAIEPRFTGPLEHAVRSHIEPAWNGEYQRLPLHPQARHEAERGRDVLASMCQPIDRQQLVAWLYPLAAASRIVPSDEDFMAKASVIAVAVSDFPRACFTAETQREALRVFKYFPSAADVCDLLEPTRKRLVGRYQALVAMLRPREPDPEPTERQKLTQAQRDAILAEFHPKFEAVMAEARQPEIARTMPKAMPMSDGALLATYEKLAAEGNSAAAIRVQMLRDKIARFTECVRDNNS